VITDRRHLATRLAAVALALALAACGEDGPMEPEPTDPCTPARIGLGGSVGGFIDADACERGGYPVDRWTFDLTAETDIRIDLTSSTIDPVLELQTTSGGRIAFNDDFNGLNSMILTRLSAGSYVIQVRDYGGGTGPYELSLRRGPDCSPVGELQLGETETGSLASDDCIWEAGGQSDNWTLVLGERTNLRIEAKSPDFDEVVLIRDQQGFIMNGADELGPTGFARFDMEVPAGEWTITVGALTPGRTGSYELTVDLTPPCTPALALVLGQTEAGSIDADDCMFEGFAPADSFALVLDQETPLDFNLKSSDMQPFLIVRDHEGRDVVVADDMGRTGNVRTQAALQAGAYAVYVTTFDYPPTGSYQLTVSELACKEPTPIAFGATETGTLGDDDCLRANGAWQEPWSLELANETVVRIDMESDDVDAYLVVKDDLGNAIAEDDDGGDGYDARVEATLAAGGYEIVATSFAQGQEGTYTLSVDAPPAPAATPAALAEAESGLDVDGKDVGLAPGSEWRDRLAELRSRLVPEWLGGRKSSAR
jgi:predicted small lipoprotein YifL